MTKSSDQIPDRLRVHLFRHGHLENSEKSLINGSTDIPLSEKGRRQMAFWGRHLNGVSASFFISSTLSRTRESLSLVKSDREGETLALESFCERRFGSWEGLTREEISARDPEGYKRWLEVDPSFAPESGESLFGFSKRVLSGLDEVLQKTGFGKEIVMVCHSGTNRILILHALGLSIQSYFRFSQEHAAHNVIDFYRDHPPCLMTLNQTPESILGSGNV
ncbi:MAG: histidine phosphatase family protein [Leptospirillum sp.]